MDYIITALISYLFGSIPFGYIFTKIFLKKDIRDVGSGNIGATNVLRTGNKRLGYLTLILDILKAVIPVIYVKLYYPDLIFISALCAFLGHLFPVWLKFDGGKGVATYVGVYIAFSTLNPYSYSLFENSYFLYLNIPLLAVFYFVIFKISRISAIASLLTVFISNLILFSSFNVFQDRLIVFLIFWLIVFKHSENLKRLYEGRENKF